MDGQEGFDIKILFTDAYMNTASDDSDQVDHEYPPIYACHTI